MTLSPHEHYLGLGFGLVHIPVGTKGPRTSGWQDYPVVSPEEAERIWSNGGGVGLHHASSRTAVLDVDHPEYAETALKAVGIDLPAILNAPGPKIRGAKGLKPVYRLPDGVELKRHALAWKDPVASKTVTVFELRAGMVQDVLPPSLHPETGNPYIWEPEMPECRSDIPELPGGLLTLWQNWEALRPMLEGANPWAPTPPLRKWQGEEEGVIDQFNAQHTVGQLLERHGYMRRDNRYLSPHSETGAAGVVVLTDDGGIERAYSHHGSDPLADGHSHDAFDVIAILEHGGDKKAAYRAAAEELGLPIGKVSDVGLNLGCEPDAPRVWEVQPFPLQVLPHSLRCFVKETSDALPCPPDFIAIPALTLMGAAIGTSRVLEAKPSWREGARLYTGIVADAGSRKSPALSAAAAPFYKKQREAHDLYRLDKERYERALEEYEGEKKATPKPVEPVMQQSYTTDATLEALAVLHERNPRSLVFLQDELTAWVRAMNQYKGGKGSDRQKWLSFWSGAPEVVNRKGKEPVVLHNPFINVVGCVPPDVLGELTDERGREDGFVHRILFAYPEPVALRWTDATVSETVERGYQRLFDRLWSLEPASDEHGQATPKVLRFTEVGKAAFVEWIGEHYAEQQSPELPAALRGPWAKLDGYGVRFALILHLARYADGEVNSEDVDEVSVLSAATLISYFKSHLRRIYARLNADERDKETLAVAAWLKRTGGEASLRDITRSGVAGIRSVDHAKKHLDRLQAQGLGEYLSITYPSGQKGDGYRLLPPKTPDT